MFKTRQNLLSVLRPLCILLRITGFALFSQTTIKNDSKISYFTVFNCVTYIFHIVYIGYAVVNTATKFTSAPDTLRLVYALVFLVNAFALIGTNIIWDKYKNDKFLQLLKQFYNFDKKLQRNNIFLDYEKLRSRSAAVLIIEATIYAYFNTDTAYQFWKMGIKPTTIFLDFIYYGGLHAMQVTMTGKCFTLFAIIENIFDRLSFTMKTDEASPDMVRNIRHLYHETYELVVQVNEVIAFQLVVPFCVTFIMVVFHIYYQIVDSSLQESVTVLVWLSTILLKLVVVIVQIHGALTSVKSYLILKCVFVPILWLVG